MTRREVRAPTDLKRIVIFLAFILVVAVIVLRSQYVNASDPDNVDCTRCHPMSMERHRFPTSPCTTCHSTDMSTLMLKNGKVIPIEQSPALCAQCHAEFYQAWKDGKHGIVTINCTGCHDPHFINKPQTIPLITIPLTSVLQILVAGGTVIGLSLVTLVAATKLREK
jgi:hypothetical protein